MNNRFVTILLFIGGSLFFLSTLSQLMYVNGVKFDPVSFDKLPLVILNSSNDYYELRADFSIDYGDETVIEKNIESKKDIDIVLDKNNSSFSIQVSCDSNDVCGTSLAPSDVKIYLVNSDIPYEQIVNSSIPTLELADNDCEIKSIKDCANFDFTIPNNIVAQNYTIVLDMSFDEAKWAYIYPVQIK